MCNSRKNLTAAKFMSGVESGWEIESFFRRDPLILKILTENLQMIQMPGY